MKALFFIATTMLLTVQAQVMLPHRRSIASGAGGASLGPPNYVLAFNGRQTTGAGQYSLGIAYSADYGSNWTDAVWNPILSGTAAAWDANGTFQPTINYDGTNYVIHYVGWNGTYRKIGRATSSELSLWAKYSGNPVVDLGASTNFDSYGLSTPFVWYNTNEPHAWQMWYSGRTNAYDTNTTIGYAYSSDGITWTKFGEVLGKGTAGAFDDEGLASGAVLKDGSTYYLFYSGYHASLYHSGYATFTNATNAYTKHGVFTDYSGPISFGGTNYYSNYIRAFFNRGDLWQIYTTLFHTNNTGIEGPEFSFYSTAASITAPGTNFVGPLLPWGGTGWHAMAAENPATIPVSVAFSSNPPPALVWYKLNEGSGTNLIDSSGNGNSGWLKGGTWVTGKSGSGNAISLTTATDYARTSNTLSYATSIVTVTAWVKLNSVAGAANQIIWGSDLNTANTNWIASFLIASDARLFGNIYGRHNGASWLSTSYTYSSLSAAQWYHIAIVYDNTTTAGFEKLYLNGLKATFSLNATTKDNSGNLGSYVLYLGNWGGGASQVINGSIDDFRIYAGELTPAQIYTIYSDPQ